jgi:hypothetical protein
MVAPKIPTPKAKAPSAPPHLQWLVDTGKALKTADGRIVQVMEFRHKNNAAVLSAWAKHFRNQYCRDDQIDALRRGTPHSRAEYLRRIKFPDAAEAPGPSIRAGDFAEMLVADYVEFTMAFWLPRTRYDHKTVRNESTKGTDIIGFKFLREGKFDPKDTLAFFETKAQLTGNRPTKRLQVAIDDSAKDHMRKAESLNAIKQRMLDANLPAEAARVERFQDPEDNPYVERYGAVALLSTPVFDPTEIAATTTSAHPKDRALLLIVIHGKDMMDLVHTLYERAADEA